MPHLRGSLRQLLAFPLSRAPDLIWANEGTLSGFSEVLGYFVLAPTSLRTEGAIKLAVVATVSYQAVFVLAFASTIASHMYGSVATSNYMQKVSVCVGLTPEAIAMPKLKSQLTTLSVISSTRR